ncbi:TPA: hypothetical protein DCF80_02515 [Candidatus Saccharibacteria bacterium]|nr:hypothetical protein [Candidatus Saccharibacteria bacterium]HRK41350.1 HAMP domain-containing sensor histidine kinase [Candidatus Saccharibacteria bacterium]
MKNLKAHHHLAVASMLIFGVVGVWTWGTMVFAGNSTTVTVNVGPADSCPNIPGYQTSVPSGMLVDGDGNCYTPPPPAVDMCDNLAGAQETIPDGYYHENSSCFPQPTPPKDVCPNLTGTQNSVPEGYTNTENGLCVRPAADMCSNITGTQALVPDELDRAEDGTCFTPSVTSPNLPPSSEDPPLSPQEPGIAGLSDLKNVPAFFEPFLRPYVDMIPLAAQEALRAMPPIVARTFPYFTFAILAISAAIMGWQSGREILAARRMTRAAKREHDIAAEKDNFIHLASHYFKSPLMAMNAAAGSSSKRLTTLLKDLETDIDRIVSDIDSNSALSGIKAPEKPRFGHLDFISSSFFWLPVATALVIAWTSNFFLGVVGNVEIGTFNLIAQAGVFIASALFFYSSVRTHHIKLEERDYREQVLAYEEALDHARNEFIENSVLVLTNRLEQLDALRDSVPHEKSRAFARGFDDMRELLHKFKLLSEIETGVTGASEKFDLRASVDELVRFYLPRLDEKNLRVVVDIPSSTINQRRSLFDFVLGSLIDNAIKFAERGGTITISAVPHEHSLTVQVSDSATTAVDNGHKRTQKAPMRFTYDGLGLSLFLDRIIMDSLGGSLSLSNAGSHQSTINITVPKK